MNILLPSRAKSTPAPSVVQSVLSRKGGLVSDYPGAEYLAREMANWVNSVSDNPSDMPSALAYLNMLRDYVERLLTMDVSGEIAALEATIEHSQTALAALGSGEKMSSAPERKEIVSALFLAWSAYVATATVVGHFVVPGKIMEWLQKFFDAESYTQARIADLQAELAGLEDDLVQIVKARTEAEAMLADANQNADASN